MSECSAESLSAIADLFDSMNQQQMLFQQALGHFQRGQFDEALPFIEQSYKLGQKQPQVINLYGATLGELGMFDEARKLYEKARDHL